MGAIVSCLGHGDDFINRILTCGQKFTHHDQMVKADAPGRVSRRVLFELVKHCARIPGRIYIVRNMGNPVLDSLINVFQAAFPSAEQ